MKDRKIMWVPIYDDYAQGWTPIILEEDNDEEKNEATKRI